MPCITRDAVLRLPPVPKNQQAKYHHWTPEERQWLADANRNALAMTGSLFDAVEGLTGSRDPDWWRCVLEVGRSTGRYLSADELGDLPIRDCAAIMRAAAEMKAEQRTDLLKVIRQAITYAPKPGTRAARMLIALHAANADHASTAISVPSLNGEQEAPPLTDTEKAVLDVIRGHSSGITGNEIIAQPDCRHLIQSTLTRHIIPRLKEHYGVKNRRGVGYYIPSA